MWFWKKRSPHGKTERQESDPPAAAAAPTVAPEVSIGVREPICPYCGVHLSAMPGAKKRCPSCRQSIYVRTHPEDRVKVLLREDEVLIVDGQRHVARAMDHWFDEDSHEVISISSRLRKKIGRDPTRAEVRWSFLNEKLLEHAARLDWGLYCGVRSIMASHRLSQGQYEPALRTHLEVCYLGMNNPSNMGGTADPELLRQFPPFEARPEWLTPEMLEWIAKLAKHLKLTTEDIRNRFMAIAVPVHRAMKLPLSPDDAWVAVQEGLGKWYELGGSTTKSEQ